MLQYMQHESHGVTIVYDQHEVARHEKLGWQKIEEPKALPANPSDTLTIPRRRGARVKS